MLRLRGRGIGAGTALGSASVLRAPNGIPLLPARMVAQMAKANPNAPIEPMEVILVARDYETAAGLALPWARVVGIAAERMSDETVGRGVPTVVGIEELLSVVPDESLMLIDGDRGIVLVDPDGMAIAAYQAEKDSIAPRRRLYLDYAHQPARTIDGRELRVVARVESVEEVRRALDEGADALHVTEGAALIDGAASDDAQHEALLRIAEWAAGKPITIAGGVEAVSIPALMRAALHADFALAVPLSLGAEGFGDLQLYLQEVREELLAEEVDYSDVRIAGVTDLNSPCHDALADYLIGRIIIERVGEEVFDTPAAGAERELFDSLVAQAGELMLPVEAALPDARERTVRAAVGLGASGLIVPPDSVRAVKEQIRSLDAAACREEMLGTAESTSEGDT